MLNAIFHRGAVSAAAGSLCNLRGFHGRSAQPRTPRDLRDDPPEGGEPHHRLRQGRSRLLSGGCFLSGYRDWTAKVTIDDPEEVYPVAVSRMPLSEYNQRLREAIGRTCAGCLRCKAPTARDQSLHCYYGLLSLDGVCFSRYDEKPAPRSFSEGLMWLGGGFMRLRYAQLDAEALRGKLKEHLQIVCDAAEKTTTPDGTVLLTVTPKKKELLPPLLMQATGRYLHGLTGSFRLCLPSAPDLSPDTLTALVSHGDVFRKECRKYGVSLAELTWDGQDRGRIEALLQQMNKACLLYPMHLTAERAFLLLMDEPAALRQLRFHAPMLQAHSALITVHDACHSRRYTIRYDMPFIPL